MMFIQEIIYLIVILKRVTTSTYPNHPQSPFPTQTHPKYTSTQPHSAIENVHSLPHTENVPPSTPTHPHSLTKNVHALSPSQNIPQFQGKAVEVQQQNEHNFLFVSL